VESITIENLSKIYRQGLRQRKVLAVNDLNLTVSEGEIFGFLGPNGAGKSTTIKILCDLIRPTHGRASIRSRDVRQPEARRQMGYLPEHPNYYAFLTGWELLEFNGTIHGESKSKIRKRGEILLEKLNMNEAAHRPLRTYSKGMIQRLGIAVSLIHDPRVVIFDEPMSGLDPVGRKLVKDLMLHLRAQGKTIFFSTHILHDVEIICDRIGIIAEGQLKFSGALEEVISESFSSYEVVFRNPEPHQVQSLQEKRYSLRTHEDRVELEVDKEKLSEFLGTCLNMGLEPYTIEPRRFGLEDFFMDFISESVKVQQNPEA
jgi:ABC-2 type transport system ATP-binding protein